MAKVLFTAWPFAGHIHPCLAIAQSLRERGHEVAFYTGHAVRSQVEGEGFPCFTFQKVPEERVHALASSEIPYCSSIVEGLRKAKLLQSKYREWLLDTIPSQVEDIAAVMLAWRPDIIVCDLSLWGPILVLHETRGIPVAVLSIFAACMLPGPDAPAWGQGRPRPRNAMMRLGSSVERALVKWGSGGFRREVDALRSSYGLPKLDCTVTEFAAQMPVYLVPSTPEYDYHRRDLPPNVHYVGPCLWDKAKQAPPPGWISKLPDNQLLVYVTEATVGTEEPLLLKASLQAFRDTPLQVVMTAGTQRNIAELNLGPPATNVRIESYVPQSDLLSKVSVMVTLGGSGGVLAALKAGVPLVVVPTQWDRPENAQRVAEAGAGLRLSAERCTPERLRATVQRVLDQPAFRENAQRLARAFAQRGPSYAARLVEQLAPHGVSGQEPQIDPAYANVIRPSPESLRC